MPIFVDSWRHGHDQPGDPSRRVVVSSWRRLRRVSTYDCEEWTSASLGRFERGGSRVAPVFGEPVMIFCALYLDREYIQVIIGQE